MNDVLWTAVIVAASATVSPLMLAFLTNRQRDAAQKKDWARQDQLIERTETTAALLLAANERVAQGTKVTNDKLDVIHTLVNSNMTAAMQAEHDATVRELAMMREVIALHRADGREPNVESLAAIDSTEHRIAELKASLADRLTQAKAVEVQQTEQAKH